MHPEAQTMADHRERRMSNGVLSRRSPPPLNGFGGGMAELPLLLPSVEVEVLEAVAHEQGLTLAQLARLIISGFLGRTSSSGELAATIRTRYGRHRFKTTEEFIRFQRDCPHPTAKWTQGGCHEALVCEQCWAVLDAGWPDDHPEISRWLNEGGAPAR